jgi:beta-galactosidase
MRIISFFVIFGCLISAFLPPASAEDTSAPVERSYRHEATYRFPEYVSGWEDRKYDLWFGKRPAIYLNGWWELIKLKGTENNPSDDYGAKNGFYREGIDTAGWTRMFVPWQWNDGDPADNFRGVGWYRRTFRVPAEYKGKRLILKFFDVQSEARVYLNGQEIDRHEGYWMDWQGRTEFGAFEKEITDHVRFGEKDNLLAVRVYESTGKTGGIWQPAQIEVRETVFIDPILVNCDIAKKQIRIRAFFDNGTGQKKTVPLYAELGPWTSYRYQPPDSISVQTVNLGTVDLPPGRSEKEFTFTIRDPKLWDYDRPNLYHLRFLSGKAVLGQARFGFRQIDIRGVHFFLNGRKMWIPGDQLEGMSGKGNFFQFNKDIEDEPDAHFLSQHNRNLTEWIQRYQYYNLRLIRAHTDCWPEPMFDRADEMGMLTYPELGHPESLRMPNTNGRRSLLEEFESGRPIPADFKEQVRRRMYAHWNHPSVWAFSLGNELYDVKFTPYLCEMFEYLKKDVRIPFPLTQSGRHYMFRADDAFTPRPDFYDDHFYWTWEGKWNHIEKTCADLATYLHGRLDRPWFNGECFGTFEAYHYESLFKELRTSLPGIDRELYARLMNRTEDDFGEYWKQHWNWAKRYTLMYGIRQFLQETEQGNPGRAEYYKRMVETHRRWNQYVTGFATHRVWPPRPEKKTPFGEMMRRVNSPLYACTNLYFRHHFPAGQELTTTIYTFNDTLGDVRDVAVNIDLLAPDGRSAFHQSLRYDKLAQGQKQEHRLTWKIPDDQPTGHYRLELQLQQAGRDVVDNDYRVYILGPDGRRKKIDTGGKRIVLYEKPTGSFTLCLEQTEHLGTIPFVREFRLEETAPTCADLIVPEHPIYAGLEAADWDMWDDDPAKVPNPTSRGVINTRMIQPLTPAVLASSGIYGGYATYGKPGMLAAEVRIGKGIVLFSMADACRRFGRDGVATRYVENLLHYTLGTLWDGKQISDYAIPSISGPELQEYEVPPIPSDRAVFVDLRKVAHRRLAGVKDGAPGLFDQGPQEGLDDLPVGRQTFHGVPFDIIDPAGNDGKSCVVLHTNGNGRFQRGDRPEEVVIPVHRKLKRLVFLVTSAWTDSDDKPAAEFIITFAGGQCLFEREAVPLKGNVNLGNWWITEGLLPGAKLAWSSKVARQPCPIGVWMFEWTNRQPQAEIAEIRFRTGHTRTIPALIAITGESAETK